MITLSVILRFYLVQTPTLYECLSVFALYFTYQMKRFPIAQRQTTRRHSFLKRPLDCQNILVQSI